VAQTVINSAKVEVEYLQKTGQISAPFLEVPPDAPYLTGMVTLPSGAKLASHKHRLQG
jgi:quercetin dioxygenase-like cupin family protein